MAGITSEDMQTQGAAFQALMTLTAQPLDDAYEVWDDLIALLRHKNNRTRAIAAQVLCGLAKSDPKARMKKDVAALLALTKDEKFVTARHCMQSLWKVGAAGTSQRKALLKGLEERFRDCVAEKNCTLIRYDICECLRKVFDNCADDSAQELALRLIATEPDLKYRRKYSGLWKDLGSPRRTL
jgi:hypothetical protein